MKKGDVIRKLQECIEKFNEGKDNPISLSKIDTFSYFLVYPEVYSALLIFCQSSLFIVGQKNGLYLLHYKKIPLDTIRDILYDKGIIISCDKSVVCFF